MVKKKEYCSLGIMSGTSIDGLDFSLIKTNGKNDIKTLFNCYYKFNSKLKQSIKSLIKKFNTLNYKSILESNDFMDFNRKFTELIIKKVNLFLKKYSINISSLDVIGVHGNTLLHNPKAGLSIQLGDPLLLSKKLKITIISNFRDNDIKKNGQGAPLVPIFHQCKFSENKKNVMVVNLGGISNFSFFKGRKITLASDIGPGNKLLDEFCSLNFNVNYDKNGELSSKGIIIPNLIEKWKKKKFINDSIPISYDNAFFRTKDFIRKNNYSHLDILRSLTYFSAYLIFNINKKLNYKIDKWIFSGGGVENKTLMNDLKKLLGTSTIFKTEIYGLDPFFIESMAFAYISVRTLKNLPSSFPQTTGCSERSVSGLIQSIK